VKKNITQWREKIVHFVVNLHQEEGHRMKKQLVIIGILAILVGVGLSGCNQITDTINPERNRFIGSWLTHDPTWGNQTVTFLSDGTYSDGMLLGSGTWALKDGKLTMDAHLLDLDWVIVNNYLFSDNDRTLTLTYPGGTSSQVYSKL